MRMYFTNSGLGNSYDSDHFLKTELKGQWPLDDLWPHFCWGHMCDSTQVSLRPKYVDTVTIFQNLNQATTHYRRTDRLRTEWVIT